MSLQETASWPCDRWRVIKDVERCKGAWIVIPPTGMTMRPYAAYGPGRYSGCYPFNTHASAINAIYETISSYERLSA